MEFPDVTKNLEIIMNLKEANQKKWSETKKLFENSNNLTSHSAKFSPLDEEKVVLLENPGSFSYDRTQEIILKIRDLFENFKQTIEACSKIQDKVINEYLKDWTDNHIRSREGLVTKPRCSLDTIQRWCEVLMDVESDTKLLIENVTEHRNSARSVEFEITLLRQRLTEFKKGAKTIAPHGLNLLPELALSVDSLLKNLIEHSLVVVQQPPEAMKVSHGFDAGVRFLLGSFHRNQNRSSQVKVAFKHETEATVGNLCNDVTYFEYNENGQQCWAQFRNLKLTDRPKKAGKRTAESVLDEKHYLYFETQFTLGVGAEATSYTVGAFSLPVAISTNVSQEYKAMATIFWDSVFVGPNRRDFDAPQATSWETFAKALSDKFEIECGRSLQPNHLTFLRDKFFNGAPLPDATVTWSQFCSTPLEGRRFTFWEWFNETMSFCKKYLKQLWTAGLIMGFISRPDAEKILKNFGQGTFLIRFSEGELGAITVAYVDCNKEITHLGPLNADVLEKRCLVDCIGDLDELVCLYPLLEKSIFKKYKENVKRRLRVRAPPKESEDQPSQGNVVAEEQQDRSSLPPSRLWRFPFFSLGTLQLARLYFTPVWNRNFNLIQRWRITVRYAPLPTSDRRIKQE